MAHLLVSCSSRFGAVIVPAQEAGVRPARALPYRLSVSPTVTASGVRMSLSNNGSVAAVFHTRSRVAGAGALVTQMFTVGAGRRLGPTLPRSADADDVEVHGPTAAEVTVTDGYGAAPPRP